ncbi:Phage/plasmid primase, P4 [Nosema bombycis CQ1]|uniref:Phage/plasmid primase, P4 n=1 Tax=Nosema bombycis (strain CQ1 / CVCC 102059) TaxID=578461 RepID=R0M3G0_NOSB1|nr:Phage/plasmid primase, P4 [Nosema bombycis CQ1]|eukprot:EOB12554.1 Phage/plasmid primase, P4 [Nosema bombycis CQ1]
MLLSATFVTVIIDNSYCKFIDNNFLKQLDNNMDIIPFSNGVYDLLMNSFRKYNDNDYVSQYLPYDYDKNASSKMLDKFLTDLYNTNDELLYVLRMLASFLTPKRGLEYIFLKVQDKMESLY